MVFSARDRLTGHIVALKCIGIADSQIENFAEDDTVDAAAPAPPAVSPAAGPQGHAEKLRLALAREFRTLSSLRHPHIVSVLDFGFDTFNRPFFTMELLPARRTLTQAGQSLPLIGKLRLLAQLLRALIYLHRRGILHRDIKPSNVLSDGDSVKVLDFGIAAPIKSTKDLAGTLVYMAPEVLLGENPSPASDLYAVGVLTYELLTGRFPYSRDSVTKMLLGVLGQGTAARLSETALLLVESYRIKDNSEVHSDDSRPLDQAPEPLRMEGIPEPLARLVAGLLCRDAKQRYSDAAAVLAELSDAVGESFPAETAATRDSLLQAAGLVGREGELAQLDTALDLTFSGQGSAWLIGGESGVGKSRLLDELRTLAMVRGAQVACGQAVDAARAVYQVWQGALRSLCLGTELDDVDAGVLRAAVPDIATLLARPVPDCPPVNPKNAQARFLASVEKLLVAQTEPLVLVLEDLHWAEPASLAVLAHLVPSITRRPILVIGSYRNDERPRLPEELPGARSLPLRRLSEQEVALLSVSMLGEVGRSAELVTLLKRETEGNPFFIVEILRAFAEEAGTLEALSAQQLPQRILTGGVRAILERRLHQLPPWAIPLLELAAVLGRTD